MLSIQALRAKLPFAKGSQSLTYARSPHLALRQSLQHLADPHHSNLLRRRHP